MCNNITLNDKKRMNILYFIYLIFDHSNNCTNERTVIECPLLMDIGNNFNIIFEGVLFNFNIHTILELKCNFPYNF